MEGGNKEEGGLFSWQRQHVLHHIYLQNIFRCKYILALRKEKRSITAAQPLLPSGHIHAIRFLLVGVFSHPRSWLAASMVRKFKSHSRSDFLLVILIFNILAPDWLLVWAGNSNYVLIWNLLCLCYCLAFLRCLRWIKQWDIIWVIGWTFGSHEQLFPLRNHLVQEIAI